MLQLCLPLELYSTVLFCTVGVFRLYYFCTSLSVTKLAGDETQSSVGQWGK